MDDAVSLVERRHELLDALLDAPRSKPELVEATTYARSTVDRAIRELEDAELVERDGACYELTPAAARMTRAYEEFRCAAGLYYDAREAIAGVPCDEPLPKAVLDGARIDTASPEAPNATAVQGFSELEDGDVVHVACARLLDMYDRYVYRLAKEESVEFRAIFTPSVIEAIESEYLDRFLALVDDGFMTAHVLEEIPSYTLFVTEGLEHARDGTKLGIAVHDEDGVHMISNDAPEAVEWGWRTWESLLAEAEQAYPAPD